MERECTTFDCNLVQVLIRTFSPLPCPYSPIPCPCLVLTLNARFPTKVFAILIFRLCFPQRFPRVSTQIFKLFHRLLLFFHRQERQNQVLPPYWGFSRLSIGWQEGLSFCVEM